MSGKIGIDFGTTNTTIAFLDDRDQVGFFVLKPQNPTPYIPTKVFYSAKDNACLIGHDAISKQSTNIGGASGDFYEFFKMLLPLPLQETEKSPHWVNKGRTPQAVTRDYLKQLLDEYQRQKGAIDRVVCSVPELWQRSVTRENPLPSNPGAEHLKSIVGTDIGLNLGQLCSEPVCAAAYFAHVRQSTNKPFTGNLLVCDMGGGTFDVALCKVLPAKIEVLMFDGQGHDSLGSAGVAFDHSVVKQVLPENMRQNPQKFQRRAWAFEEQKIIEDNNQNIAELVRMMKSDNSPFLNEAAYKFVIGDDELYTVTYQHVFNGFKPIKEGIQATLSRIKAWTKQHGISIDELIIVGGFGRFPLVQRAIVETLDWQKKFDETFHYTHMLQAIAAGAAIIAGGRYQIVEKYPHAIGLDAKRTTPHGLENFELEIIGADKNMIGGAAMWANFSGRRIPVEIRDGSAVPLWLKIDGREKIFIKTLSLGLERGSYEVGATIDSSYQAALLFKRADTGKETKIPIGDVRVNLLVR